MPIRHPAVAVAAACFLAGCASGPDANLQDHGILMPTLRFEFERAHRHRAQPADEPPRRSVGLGLEVTGGGGSFAGGDGEYNLVSVQGHVSLSTPTQERLRAAALLGLEYLNVDLTRQSATTEIDDGGSFGPFAGFDVGYEVVDLLECYAHGTATALLPPSSSLRGELGLRFQPGPPLQLFLAYRWWRLQRDDVDLFGTNTDLDLHTDGVVFGMSLLF